MWILEFSEESEADLLYESSSSSAAFICIVSSTCPSISVIELSTPLRDTNNSNINDCQQVQGVLDVHS